MYIAVQCPLNRSISRFSAGHAAWRLTALQEPKQSAQLALDPITHSSSGDLRHALGRLRGMIAGVEGTGFS